MLEIRGSFRLISYWRRLYLQTDGYASYNAVCKQEGITQAGCFDHVRSKFTDAKKGEAKPGKKVKNARVSKADVALGKIRKLYAIEAEIEKLSAVKKLAIRQEKSKPLLDDLHQWLEKNITRLVPEFDPSGDELRSEPVAKTGHIL
ncbi:IS66 family transposase [Endozoicomonas gorgoniicola]|uniref:IS66 family transposase n=1 Tax=Endozoicomonas gorgoniicola TaxID=1234144 RepID=A0ABT3MWK2_9GAMM|nr:IS66 family transposase [Endozoicomonas gorgoniicola]MCW7553735.1 IS66 family transposase [Endozoicomonas gorgoniicola]